MHATHFCANLRSMRGRFSLTALLMVLGITLSLRASDPTRDFSGKWVLDPSASDIASLGQVETNLNVSQGGGGILCSAGAVQWSYALDGSETRKQIGEESRSSVIKWEGAARLVNTQVSRRDGPGVAERSVLIDHVNVAVAVAAARPDEVGCVILQILALAETQERRHAIVDLAVQLGVEFVAVVADQQQRLVIVGAPRTIGRRQPAQHRGGERIQLRDGNLRVGWINYSGQRVDHRHGEDTLAIRHAGDGVEIEIARE